MTTPVPVTVHRHTSASPSHALAVIMPIDLPTVFRGLGPLPAVVGVVDQTGPWTTPGETRRPLLSGGSTATETLTGHEPGRAFRYEITGFTHPFLRRLVDRVEGEWVVEADGPGTRVVWTYTFVPLPRRRTLLRLGLVPIWRVYMRRVLAASVRQVEGVAPAPS